MVSNFGQSSCPRLLKVGIVAVSHSCLRLPFQSVIYSVASPENFWPTMETIVRGEFGYFSLLLLYNGPFCLLQLQNKSMSMFQALLCSSLSRLWATMRPLSNGRPVGKATSKNDPSVRPSPPRPSADLSRSL